MWTKEETNFYSISKYFDIYQYKITVWIEESDKSLKYWVGVSSGNKRKDLEVFEEKDKKSYGGLKALIWIKNSIFSFPDFYKRYVRGRKEYICIQWSDSRRRDIYERLIKYGFRFQTINGEKTLIKKL